MKKLLYHYLESVNSDENLYKEYVKILGKIKEAGKDYAVFYFNPSSFIINRNLDVIEEKDGNIFLDKFFKYINLVSVKFSDIRVNYKYISNDPEGFTGSGTVELVNQDIYNIKNAEFILRNILKSAYKEFKQ